jgi:hypothetical protein
MGFQIMTLELQVQWLTQVSRSVAHLEPRFSTRLLLLQRPHLLQQILNLGEKVMPFAMTHGFTVAFKFSAALLFVGAIVLFFFINIGKESLVETEGAGFH